MQESITIRRHRSLSDPTNALRADMGHLLVTAQAVMSGDGSPRDALRDALANLMHYCQGRDEESFEDALEMARMHFEAETSGMD